MSRHRDVRNLNIHDELAEDEDVYEEEEEMTEEQKEQMDLGLAQVRSVLGDPNESGIDDKQIKDALWDSFFDVEGTISWLLDQKAKQAAAAAKKAPEPDEAIQAPLSALQRLALQRKQVASTAGIGAASERPSGLAGLVKGIPRKIANSATQPQPKLDTPSTASVIPASVAPPPKTSKLSALAQRTAAQRATPAPASSTASIPSNTPSKSAPLSKLALRIKAQKDAQEAASRPQPPIDAHRPEPDTQASKPEFTLFGNLRPTAAPSPSGSRANHIRKLKSGPSSFGDILISRRDGADITGPLAQIYSEVIFAPSSAFQFNTPSPDDAVMAAREGTRLNAYKKASTVIGSRK